MMRHLLIVCVLASTAYADKPASLAHYEKGKQAYAAGKFELAVAEFERAYAAWNAVEYLHDIGQAYRRLGRCNEAATSLERYLAGKADAPNRAAVEGHVRALRAKCPAKPAAAPAKPAAAPAPAPAPVAAPAPAPVAAPAPAVAAPAPAVAAPAPAAVAAPAPAPAPIAAPAPGAAAAAPTAPAAATAPAPRMVDATASSTGIVQATRLTHATSPWHPTARAGIVLLDAGPVVMPALVEVGAGVLRDMGLPHNLQLGASLTATRLPYNDQMSGTVWLVGPEAIAAASHPIASRITATGGIALGAQLISGLGEGNPFTTNGAEHGSFVMLRLRGELGVAWRASDRVTVRIAPLGYQFSPRRAPLAADIRALHGFSAHAGVSVDL